MVHAPAPTAAPAASPAEPPLAARADERTGTRADDGAGNHPAAPPGARHGQRSAALAPARPAGGDAGTARALQQRLGLHGPRPRLLIVRQSALGDIVFATALLAGLRAAWPDATIHWLAQAGFAGVLDSEVEAGQLDAVIRVPAGLYRSPRALLALRRQLGEARYDLVIEAQGLAKSRLLAALAPGARRLGFASREPLGFVLHESLPKGGDVRDIASEYRYLAQALTGQPAPAPRLHVSARARQRAVETLAAAGVAPGYIALCPFTTRPQKHWIDAHWPELIARLDRPCAILGGPGDREHAERLVAASGGRAISLAGRSRLDEVAAFLEQAALVIGVDTGLTHIGTAVRRPTLALFGSTCPYLGGAESPLTVLYDALPCAPCKRHPTCAGRYDCLRGITPARVAAAAQALLAGGAAD